jgi:ATP-binding protein involved in chromosome partitioning
MFGQKILWPGMTMVIAVMSGKGGVGKTSVAAMIAQILSEAHRTIVLDFDICGPSVARALGVEGSLIKTDTGFRPLSVRTHLDVLSFGSALQPTDAVIWRGAKKLVLLSLFYNSAVGYDYVVIDTPPGVSEEHEFLVDKGVRVVTVTTPQNISLSDTQRCIEFCRANSVEILGLVENMSWTRCQCCDETYHPFGSKGGRQLADEYSIRFLGELELETQWSEAVDQGASTENYKKLRSYNALKMMLSDLQIL